MQVPYARQKRDLNAIVREGLMAHRYRDHAVDEFFDYDWAAVEGSRQAVVERLLELTGARSYLEIGCAEDPLFSQVHATRKVGVDPIHGGTHRMTSDEFFAANDDTFDVVFIDGRHLYDQARRDVMGALDIVPPGGWIALHDMFPRDWIEEHKPQISASRWTGDPWKLAFELIGAKGLEFRLLAIDHGVGVIRVLDHDVTLPDRRCELAPQRFAWFRQHFAELPVIDWAAAQDWFATSAKVRA